MASTDNRDLDGVCVTCGSGPSQQHVFDCAWYNKLMEDGYAPDPAPPEWDLSQSRIMLLPDSPLNEIAQEIHATAVDKGWWDEERSVAEMLANVHAEVSEAWEDWRVGREVMTFAIDGSQYPAGDEVAGHAFRTFMAWANAQATSDPDVDPVGELPEGTMDILVNSGVAEPVGMEVEIADVIIRCLDILAARGTDIDKVVRTKMNYNKTRAHRHGGKRA